MWVDAEQLSSVYVGPTVYKDLTVLKNMQLVTLLQVDNDTGATRLKVPSGEIITGINMIHIKVLNEMYYDDLPSLDRLIFRSIH